MKPDSDLFFPPFRLDTVNHRLWREEQPLPLRSKPLAVLRYLIEQQGRVVPAEELLHAVWPNTVVSASTIKVAIRAIRHALGDDAVTPQFIETVPGQGYRFMAPLGPSQAVPSSKFKVPSQESESLESAIHIPPAPSVGGQSAIVGREAELKRLHGWLAKSLNGTRQVVFVTGEPGIGKTSVVDTFLASLRGAGPIGVPVWVARGQCVEQYGAGEPYLPILEALERLCREPGHERLLPLLRQHAPLWLAQMPSFLRPVERERLQREVQGSTRERMLRELVAVIETLTTDTLLVLVVEDLHWSDYSTLDLLGMLARRREAARLLLLGTYRPMEMLANNHPLRLLVQDLQPRRLCNELSLTALTIEAIATYLQERFPQHRFPAGLVRLLSQRTEGNPLFLVNLVDTLVAQGLLTQEEEGWTLQGRLGAIATEVPESSRQLMAQQSARLSAAEQQVLRAASIAGAEFSAASVAAAVQTELAEVEEGCEGLAQRQQFLRRLGVSEWPDGTAAARYGFRHALYQQLWHEQVSIARRQQWHRHIGVRQEAAYGERAGEIAAELAVHFEQGQEYRRAVQYHRHAGENAARRHAPQEAIDHFTTALKLLKVLPDTPERRQQELELQATLGALLMITKGYAAPEVRQAYSRAQELCGQVKSPPQQLSHILWGLYGFHLMQAELDAAHTLARQLYTLTQSLQDTALLTETYAVLGVVAFHRGQLVQARDYTAHGAAVPQPDSSQLYLLQLGKDPWVSCLCYQALALALLGYIELARQCLHTAGKRANALAHAYTLVFYQELRCHIEHWWREPLAVAEHAQNALTLSTEHGFQYRSTTGLIFRGWTLAKEQQTAEGIEWIRQGLMAYKAGGVILIRPYYLALLAEALERAHQVTEGMAVIAEALQLTQRTGERYYEAELYRLKGQLTLQSKVQSPKLKSEAEACFHKAIAIARKQKAKLFELRAVTSLSRLWQRQGKQKQSRLMLAKIYGWFTEGFDTADLQEARKLLAELG